MLTYPVFCQLLPDKKDFVIIDSIIIKGNKRTKEKIILRELSFQIKDTVSLNELEAIIERSRQNVINTSLFNRVDIESGNRINEKVHIYITVKERWYTFPFPVFEFADRNFNVWWVEYKRDFSRTNYGIRFYQENCRGRNEKLMVVTQFGFTQKYELEYTIPFINKRMRNGLKLSMSYQRNKQIAPFADFNKLVFYQDEDYIRNLFHTSLGFSHRKAVHNTHLLDIEYHNNDIGDTIAEQNDRYFLDNNVNQQYFILRYIFERDYRDIKAYPLQGSLIGVELTKTGLGLFNDVNLFSLVTSYDKFWQLGQKNYLAAELKGYFSLPVEQPYYNQGALGYDQDFVRGYEYYVIDGQHFILYKATFKHRLFSHQFDDVRLLLLDEFRTVPVMLYLKIYFDAGYVQNDFLYMNNNNFLENSLLLGGGIGLDFITYYDIVLRMEYSWNRLNEFGFFLHFKSAF